MAFVQVTTLLLSFHYPIYVLRTALNLKDLVNAEVLIRHQFQRCHQTSTLLLTDHERQHKAMLYPYRTPYQVHLDRIR